jgi:hypothetical protein
MNTLLKAPSTALSPLIEDQAARILATLADASAATLHAFAEGLKDGPASRFSLPVYYLASNRERHEPPDRLTVSTMRSALRDSSRDTAFIDRLANAKAPFWIVVRDALVALQAECVTV